MGRQHLHTEGKPREELAPLPLGLDFLPPDCEGHTQRLRPPHLWCLFCGHAEQDRAELTARLLRGPAWLPGLETAPGSPPMALFCPGLCPFL